MNPDRCTVERLAKLIRLLGSNNPGEVNATVAAVGRILDVNGLDFNDLANWVEREAFNAGYRACQRAPDDVLDDDGDHDDDDYHHHHHHHHDHDAIWNEIAKTCLARHADWLSPWELGFIQNIATQDYKPSQKQARRLEQIVDGLKQREANHSRRPSA